ncbi:hypothetical protein FRC12_019791 [Ceratobasidium sp. 428]|nr:hypothetical protein FRC12_019791 [Ceratobasidium sp. 428]
MTTVPSRFQRSKPLCQSYELCLWAYILDASALLLLTIASQSTPKLAGILSTPDIYELHGSRLNSALAFHSPLHLVLRTSSHRRPHTLALTTRSSAGTSKPPIRASVISAITYSQNPLRT